MSILTHHACRFVVRSDWAALRLTLRQVKLSEQLAPLQLFRRRHYQSMLDYLERRMSDRRETQIPLSIFPADFDGRLATATSTEPLHGITRDISLRGIGFTHERSFQGNYALVEFDLDAAEPLCLLLEVRWSNFEHSDDVYISGGRFLGVAFTEQRQIAMG